MAELLARQDDGRLVQLATAGDRNAFDQLAAPFHDRLFNYILRLLGDYHAAEDVRQEVMILAYRRLRTYRGDAAFLSWLFAIATRACLSHRRAKCRPRDVSTDALTLASPHGNPESTLLAREEAARVERALARLTPVYRAVIVLKHLEGLDHREIAEVLGCSPETSRTRLARAQRLFREVYAQVE